MFFGCSNLLLLLLAKIFKNYNYKNMTKNYNLFKVASFVLGLIAFQNALGQVVQTFSYTGNVQTFVVPSCVSQVTLQVWGAEGGGSDLSSNTASGFGGKGGYAAGVLPVVAGNTLYVYVGGFGLSADNGPAAGGFNGGGSGHGSGSSEPGNGGGGATDFRLNGQTFGDRVIVAGGGGGGGEDGSDPYGHGGGLNGVGYNTTYDASQTAPGAGGGIGFGGTTNLGDGGGGGGGYYGGGTLSSSSIGADTQGGGGGSGYVGTLTGTSLIDGTSSMPNPAGGNNITGRAGHGIARITYTFNGTSTSITTTSSSICNGNSTTLNAAGIISYTWLPVDNFAGSNSQSVVVTPSTTTNYTLIGTNSLGCISQGVLTVTVSTGVPVLSVSSSTTSLCLGQTATLSASGALTYTWTNNVINGQSFTPTSGVNVYTVSGQNGCGTTNATTTITVSQLPVTVLATPTIVCEGFPSTLTAVSAVSGYTWLPGAISGASIIVAPTANTMYTVTASDGTCAGTQTLMLTTKTTPTITAVASTTSICEGGQVVLTASGGTSYNWTPGNLSGSTVTVNPTTSTLYMLTGTNSVGCFGNANQVVVVQASPTVVIVANKTTVCAGNQIVLSASGANTYVWSGGPSSSGYTVNPTVSTVYTVVGTQNGNICTSTKTIAITAIVPNVSLSSNTAVCDGQSTILVASGATSYSWNGIPGTATLQVTPANTTVYNLIANTQTLNVSCPTTKSVQVVVNPNPTISIVATRSIICRGESNTLTANGAQSYDWGSAGTGSNIVVQPSTNVTYTLTGTDANGCTADGSVFVFVNSCNSIIDVAKAVKLVSIYPNPSNGEINIKTEIEISLKLVNSLGQTIRRIELNSGNQFYISVEALTPGVYFLVGESNSMQLNEKIVITK